MNKNKLENLTDKQVNKMILVNKTYQKTGTLKAASEKLDISKERVRQILKKGQRLGLFEYEVNKAKQNKALVNRINKDAVLTLFKNGYSNKEICTKLSINQSELNYLRSYYAIEVKMNDVKIKKEKYLREYNKYVDKIGHHPTSAELQETGRGVLLYNNIVRYWGGIDKFRKSQNIDKPPFRYTEDFRKRIEKSIKQKRDKKNKRLDKIERYIKDNGTVRPSEIRKKLKLKPSTTTSDLRELCETGRINKEGSGRSRKYY